MRRFAAATASERQSEQKRDGSEQRGCRAMCR
jgi:hypothetical protein